VKQSIAVAQMTSNEHVDHNFDVCQRLVKEARQRSAAFLSLPENFAFFGQNSEDSLAMAEPLDGPLFGRYRALAKENQLWVSYGGFQEKAPGNRTYNAHVVVDDEGNIRSVYRKVHLFSLDIANALTIDESELVTPGRELVVAKTPVAKFGLSVCYDIRFAPLYRSLTRAGAQVLLIPAAFTATTGKAHWEVLLRARAIENQCYVAAAAQTGRHNAKRKSHGHAMIVDPWGTVLAQCPEGEGVALAPIDLSYIDAIKARMPVLKHDRPDVYQSTVSMQ
jgi:predicted amidohydrolase